MSKKEVTSQPAYTNVPTPSWSSSLGRVNNKGKQNNYKIQGIEEQEETPTNPTQSRPTKNIILGVNSGLVKYSNVSFSIKYSMNLKEIFCQKVLRHLIL